MKKDKVYLLLILLPIFDLITSLSRRFFETSFSFGIVIKFIIVIFMLTFILLYKNKDKRKLIILFSIYLLYIIIYLLLNINNSSNIFNEIYSISKFFFFPIVFFILYILIRKGAIDKDKLNKTMLISVGIYILVFALSYITRTSFKSYVGDNLGGVGWYYAANEISSIMLMLFPFIYYLLNKNKLLFYIAGTTTIFFISLIGTKVSSFGILIISLLYLILPIIFKNKDYKKDIKHHLLLIIIMVFILFGSPSMFNIKIATEKVTNEYIQEQEKFDKECESGLKCDNYYYRKIMLMLLSGRNVFLSDTNKIYKNNFNSSTFLFGLGVSNSLKIENENTNKWIEMDFFDLYYSYGVVGMLLILSPLLFVLYQTLKKKILFKNLTFDNTMYTLIILLILSVSFIAGHVISAPSVSTYLIIYLLLYLSSIKSLKEDILDKKKISILNLHFGYGGIEQANVNLANMLIDKYDIELVTLYKTIDVIPYDINPKVKIIYLSSLKPNKKEFIEALKTKKIFKIISEGIKSVKILFLKHYLVKNFIINSNSKYIVSSRIEFTKLLSYYGVYGSIKIAQEHRHHNNDYKYINKLKNSLKNIDYFLPVSKELKEYYDKEFVNTNVEYIRHALAYYPIEYNKYNGKKLITVGRLSKEKGYLDLIDIFSELTKIDKEYTLTIVGDGYEEKLIKEKIKENKLDKKIIMTGFLNKEKLNKEYLASSIYLMTSTSESFGLVLIEAMSYGMPCISLDTARGAYEVINNKNGKIVKRNKMVDTIREITKDKSTFDKMSKEARKTSNNYKFDVVKKEWLDFFERI